MDDGAASESRGQDTREPVVQPVPAYDRMRPSAAKALMLVGRRDGYGRWSGGGKHNIAKRVWKRRDKLRGLDGWRGSDCRHRRYYRNDGYNSRHGR